MGRIVIDHDMGLPTSGFLRPLVPSQEVWQRTAAVAGLGKRPRQQTAAWLRCKSALHGAAVRVCEPTEDRGNGERKKEGGRSN